MYKYMDAQLERLHKKIKRLFSRSRTAIRRDELNIIKATKQLYEELNKLNLEYYKKIAIAAYETLAGEEADTSDIDEEWIWAVLFDEYDPVTKYVYSNEVERKRARYAEAVIATASLVRETAIAERYWKRQTDQYAINAVDEARKKAFKDMGVEKVIWCTEQDNKVCGECQELEGQVFVLGEEPDKPHYNCRCWLEPYEEEETDD